MIKDSVCSINWNDWQPDERAVLCYIMDHKEKKVLLIHKKRGLGAGLINAPGGKIEPGETPEEAACRECLEEVGVCPKEISDQGELFFQFKKGFKLHAVVFRAESWEGTPGDSEEASSFWCDVDDLPYKRMWEDDWHWLPFVMEKKKFKGYFIFDEQKMCSLQINRI